MSSEVASISGIHPVKQAEVDHALATSVELVAAVTGKSIRVISVMVVAAAAVVATFEEGGGTDLTGPMTLDTNGLQVSSPTGLFWASEGQALNLLLGTAVQVSGVITYIEVD